MSPLPIHEALRTLTAARDAQAAAWQTLLDLVSAAAVSWIRGDLAAVRDHLQAAADREYELCGGCDVTGPILDALPFPTGDTE